ncbi:hypothetical protein LCGC14_1844720 [marine sediment metagenome]|uniref:Uncharacterized protein n=1 Tax=marine sediment metagenome TaxID=412755 RepID=A0A0F9IRR1_9ZZZZ
MVLSRQKGFEVYKKKKYSNGGRDRRNGNNSFSQSDKDFIEGCFKNQTDGMGLQMKNTRLELMMSIEKSIRSEGEKTRITVRTER